MSPELGGGLYAVYSGLLVAGLAGSLHCLGMCGPIVLAFGNLGDDSRRGSRTLRAFGTSLGYHAGRIWTYGVLGLVAGFAGSQMRAASIGVGWQRPLGLVAGGLVLATGLAALGVLPGLSIDLGKTGGCLGALTRRPWLATLARGQSLLLGAVMGLLPCGLVYGALIVTATLPTPWHSAIGMVIFGLGTVPALTGLVLSRSMVPRWILTRSSSLAGVLLVCAGLVMLVRSAMVHP